MNLPRSLITSWRVLGCGGVVGVGGKRGRGKKEGKGKGPDAWWGVVGVVPKEMRTISLPG